MSAQIPEHGASPADPSPSAGSTPGACLRLDELQRLGVEELCALADGLGLDLPSEIEKQALHLALLNEHGRRGLPTATRGVLEILPDGFGFLRSPEHDYVPGPDDVYVAPAQIRRFGLRTGNLLGGPLRVPRTNENYFALQQVEEVEGQGATEQSRVIAFEDLTPLHPDRRLRLETGREPLSTRVMDLLCPIGTGQRGLLVAPPRAGKTVLLEQIANGILANHPECKVFVLLVDERPEEVTDMRQAVSGKNARVIASTFDCPPSRHIHAAQIVEARARRLVERGHDVVILLDSITRLARAHNLEGNGTGKLLSGGLDAGSLRRPKQLFGAARNIDGGGSLTILGTALIETGSRMDEVIFEEFKGTGNLEVVLDRGLADRRVYPAIDLLKSGTRREELLLAREELNRVWALRKVLSGLNPQEATELLLDKLRRSETNAVFLAGLQNAD